MHSILPPTSSAHTMAQAVRAAYQSGEEDETLEPLVLVDAAGRPVGRISNGDYVIFYDIRGEREVELTRAFTDLDFIHFQRRPLHVHFTTMIQYASNLNVAVAFPPEGRLNDALVDVISAAGRRQIVICESEKAIHVSFFFNGKKYDPVAGQERVVIPSPRVADYSTTPAMAAPAVADAILNALENSAYDFILANFANVDVIGHIESPPAIRAAVEVVDREVGRVVEKAHQAGVVTVITADHGTVERWFYPDGTVDTGHTDSPTPFILIAPDWPAARLRPAGELSDVAPTVLDLLGLPTPPAMTGRSLLEEKPPAGRRVLLLVLDGWGYRSESHGNLIAQAHTPYMDALSRQYPMSHLEAAGLAVGMPAGAVGNSEVGHLHLGAGRRIYSDRVRIDRSIQDGTFFRNAVLIQAMEGARRSRRPLHLLGIVSFYSSHGSLDHLKALLCMAAEHRPPEVYLHALLGRRGERPESGAAYIEEVGREMERLGIGQVVSVIGRYWALDREENWDRIEKTYRLLVDGVGRPVFA